MTEPCLELLAEGPALSLQDGGRPGWRRFGLPPAGPLDRYSAAQANRLLGNPPKAAVLEILSQGCRLRVLRPCWLALAGAGLCADLPAGQARRFEPGELLRFTVPGPGFCAYLAVPGGFDGPIVLGSRASDRRKGIGRAPVKGDRLAALDPRPEAGFERVARRVLRPELCRDFSEARRFKLLRGPQWERFGPAARRQLVESEWRISADSDRSGYRLDGPRLEVPESIASEPVLPGTLQVPGSGRPIITLHDGPTVGGYPKIALLPEADCDWLAQCAPGTKLSFAWAD